MIVGLRLRVSGSLRPRSWETGPGQKLRLTGAILAGYVYFVSLYLRKVLRDAFVTAAYGASDTQPAVRALAPPDPVRDVGRQRDFWSQLRVWLRFTEGQRDWQHPRPYVQAKVLLLVARHPGPDLHRGLVEGQPQDRRGGHLLLRRLPRRGPPSRDQVVGDDLQRPPAFDLACDHGCLREHDSAAVVHRVVEHRAGADEAVGVRHGHAHLLAVRRPERMVRRRPVQVQRVALAAIGGGQDNWAAVGDHPEVADQSGVEDLVQFRAIGLAAFLVPSQRGAGGAGQLHVVHGVRHYA